MEDFVISRREENKMPFILLVFVTIMCFFSLLHNNDDLKERVAKLEVKVYYLENKK